MKNILLSLFIVLSLTGCEREKIEQGLTTTVSGRISDGSSGEPIVNSKVRIGEYKSRFVSDGGNVDYLSRYVDSVSTNQNGEYEMTFTTTGQGTLYKIMFDNEPADQSYLGLEGPVEIEEIGGTFAYSSIQFIKLYPCDVTITLDTAVFPIFVWNDTTRNNDYPEITATAGTYVKRIYITKSEPSILYFSRTRPDGVNQKATFTFPPGNTAGLTTQNITLSDSDFVDL